MNTVNLLYSSMYGQSLTQLSRSKTKKDQKPKHKINFMFNVIDVSESFRQDARWRSRLIQSVQLVVIVVLRPSQSEYVALVNNGLN